jgi:hypothetical protein
MKYGMTDGGSKWHVVDERSVWGISLCGHQLNESSIFASYPKGGDLCQVCQNTLLFKREEIK